MVNGKKVIELRDTGCTWCVICSNLISNDQLLGNKSDETLTDESTQTYPLAMFDIMRHHVWTIVIRSQANQKEKVYGKLKVRGHCWSWFESGETKFVQKKNLVYRQFTKEIT